MKTLTVLFAVLLLPGCGVEYQTVPNKDISLKVRSIWADVDYDSRLKEGFGPLEPLSDTTTEGLTKLEGLE